MRALVVLSAVLVLGCAQDVCTDHPVCDIRLDDCQAALWEGIQCERGASDRERPPMRVISRDAYRMLLEDAAAEVTPTRRTPIATPPSICSGSSRRAARRPTATSTSRSRT